MADYFLSDVHLRLDQPDRGERLARFVDRLAVADHLIIAGDLCDFWFASRQTVGDPLRCAGLRALRRFRDAGGDVRILPGNHDHLLGPLFHEALRVEFDADPLVIESHGLRLHIGHGHRLGSTARWKSSLESSTFRRAFGLVPKPIARGLEAVLNSKNNRTRLDANRKHILRFREVADSLAGSADLVVFGHVHVRHYERKRQPKLVVLGDWLEGESYLRIDANGACVVHDGREIPLGPFPWAEPE